MTHSTSAASTADHPAPSISPEAAVDPFGAGFLLDHQHPDMRMITDEDWLPAFRAAMAEQRHDLEQVTADDTPADVDNTLRAIGRAGLRLRRIRRAFSCLLSADGTEALHQVQAVISPELAAHRDWIQLHPGLHRRLQALAARADSGATTLNAEQARFLEQLLVEARTAGAGLDEASQARLRGLNRRLAEEEAAYQRLQRREAVEASVLVTAPAAVSAMSPQDRSAAAAAAREAGHDTGHLLGLTMPVQQPLSASLPDRALRRRLHEASTSRGTRPGEDGRTTRQIGAQIAVLRARRAEILGHRHHLDAVLPLRTATDRQAIEAMLRPVVQGGLRRLASELTTVEEHLRTTGKIDDELRPWDISYGMACVARSRSCRTEGTAGSAEGALPLKTALSRVFSAAGQVYGLQMVERADLPSFVEGARSFEAREDDGTVTGMVLLDLFRRPTKAGGAWMNSFSVASGLTGTRPVVIVCLNIARPSDGETAWVTRAEQRTLFHEYGHALHGLLAETEFDELSGTAVPRDAVEFPSQVNEVFAELWPRAEAESPEADPPDAASAESPTHDLGDAQWWGQGLKTVEHVAAVVLDLAWHTLSAEQAEAAATDPEAFERHALAAWGLDHPLVPPRYSTGGFKHIFAGSGYAAGYYSYLWAEVLAADAAEWFRGTMGDAPALARAGRRFRRELLSRGNTRDIQESFRRAVGHDPSITPMLRARGMDTPT
ncbi:M3 family metallopeptidase [Nesterenkonia suensis]